ncbi:DUF1642 domain-containing protein [Streptococcus anginosus]|uniref:DUF1642 domain-containing protein n=1 Tax=Streptococcus anginosus TaxID=1328 RepID=UPI003CF9FB70
MNKQEAIREMNKTFPPEGFTALSTLVLYSGDIIDLKSKLASIINQIEPEKPAIPQFVADWIEANKSRFSNLYNAYGWLSFKVNDVSLWVNENQDIFARAWLDGYEVEKEKKYTVQILDSSTDDYSIILGYKDGKVCIRQFLSSTWKMNCNNQLTKPELEAAGFGWVFDCEGVEVREVE